MTLTRKLFLILSLTIAPGIAHAITITIPDNGAIDGSPGEVVGYGFTFTNNSADYAVLDDSYLNFRAPFASPYTDFIASNFIEIAPGRSFSQVFTFVLSNTPGSTTQTGTGAFAIYSNASVGAKASGMLTVAYDLYNGDPTIGFTQAIYGNSISAPVSVSVASAASPSASPEPASWSLVAGALLLFTGLLRRSTPLSTGLLFLLALLALRQPASAQNAGITDPFQILTTADANGACAPDKADDNTFYWIGCCGAPGRRGCIEIPQFSCLAPDTSLKIDSYSHSIICNYPLPAYDPAVAHLFQAQPPGQDFTIYLTSDIHYFRDTFQLTDQLNHVNVINNFAGSGVDVWPAGTGALSNTKIATPLAVVINGDITTHAAAPDLGAFRLNYEEGTIPDSLKYPVLFGLGNHDINTNVSSTSDAQRLFNYLTSRMNSGSYFDPISGNYSWDWKGVHMVQLNTWAGDQTNKFVNHSDGLTWLANDLATRVGHTTTPVMIFQHYGFNYVGGDWPSNSTAVDLKGNLTGSGYEAFWQIVNKYNLVALFSGHSHCLGNYTSNTAASAATVDTSLTYPYTFPATSKYGSLVDNFDDGSGGDEAPPPCTNQTARGTFLTAHVSHNYLDVAAFGWAGNSTTAYADSADMKFTSAGSSLNQAACRRRINSQFIPAPKGWLSIVQNSSATGYTVTNTSGQAIAGPVALQFSEPGTVINYDFLDQCGSGTGKAYVLVNGESGLAAGQSYTVTTYDEVPTAVLLTPLSGVSPNAFSFTTAFATPNQIALTPGQQTLTAYGPPNGALSVTPLYFDSTTDWLTITAPPTFDQTGTAVIAINFVQSKLQNTNLGNLTASVNITAQSTGVVESPLVEITFKAPASITLTASPAASAPVGSEPLFNAQFHYTPVQIQDGPVAVTGLVNLVNQTIDPVTQAVTASQFLSATVVNGNGCITGGNLTQDAVLFGGLPSSPSNPCPSSTAASGQIYLPDNNPNDHDQWWYSSSLAPGVYKLAAAFVGSGTGDSDYAPTVSNTLLYRIGDPLVSANVYAGGSQSAPANGYFQTPLTVQVKSASSSNGGAKNAIVTFTVKPSSGKQGGSFAGQSTVTVFADSNGFATAPPLIANGTAGTWYVIATVGGLATQLTFNLTTTSAEATPFINAVFTGKSGTLPVRNWIMTFTNTGTAAAGQMTLNSLTFTPENGASCAPAIISGVPFTQPLLSSLPGSNSVSTNISLNFGSCLATARFTATANVTSNGGVYSTSVVIGHQFP